MWVDSELALLAECVCVQRIEMSVAGKVFIFLPVDHLASQSQIHVAAGDKGDAVRRLSAAAGVSEP